MSRGTGIMGWSDLVSQAYGLLNVGIVIDAM